LRHIAHHISGERAALQGDEYGVLNGRCGVKLAEVPEHHDR
jgi:hypothetical protein